MNTSITEIMAMQRTALFRQNFEDDFPFIFRFPDGKRPEYPWKIVFNTYEGPNKSRTSFTAAFDGKQYMNCRPVDDTPDAMLIEFKDHRLPPGKLCFRLLRNVPNDLFESGEQKKVLPQLTGWELWAGRTDSETPAAATVVLERMLRGIGIPSGGSAGQVVVKKSDKDYDLQWQDMDAAGGTAESLHFGSYLQFPAVGNPEVLYIDTTADKSYRWDETGLCYKCIGVGIDDEDELILDNNR